MRRAIPIRKFGWLTRACARTCDRLTVFAQRRPLTCCAAMACVGCLCALKARLSPLWWGAPSLACLAAYAAIRLGFRRRAGCFLLAFCMFAFAGYASYRDARPAGVTGGAGELVGTVCADPMFQADKGRCVVALRDVTRDGEALPCRVRAYIYGEADALEYGQTLRVSKASVWVPDGQTNPYGFDFAAYLKRSGVSLCASASLSKVEIVSERASLTRGLYRLKRNLAARIDDMYPENADVMRALLLGDRSVLSEETYEDFRVSGIVHLIALSGLHVSCIAGLLSAFLRALLLPRRAVAVCVTALLCLYARMTGMSPSIVRAVAMYALYAAARECGYPSDLLTRLSAAFLLQMAVQPLSLMDAGLQLSYASILGLALVNPLARRLIRPARAAGALFLLRDRCLDAASASLSVQVATLPLISSLFYAVPLLSLPVNLIAVPCGLFTVYLGACALALHPAFPALARALAAVPDGIWTFLRALARVVARLPFAAMSARAWPLAAGALYFAVLFVASPHSALRERTRRLCALALPVIWLALCLRPGDSTDGLRVTFLDAGYADSAVVDARGNAYPIDCGRDNGILADYLTASGATVRGIFVTHPDVDHAGGLPEVLARNEDAAVYLPECWPRMNVGENLRAALEGADTRYLRAGDEVELAEGIVAQVLWPPEGFAPKDDNNGSLVLRITCEGSAALFTGDLTDAEDDRIQASGDLLKVAHHGSKYATSEEMLACAAPSLAVISVANNAHGHPTKEVLSRLDAVGARVLRTDRYGAVIVDILPAGEMLVRTIVKPEE